mmetsp:Transcript_21836/g.62215  ORF Transcript_21836/g.62215 Transcript_21836/m.62215 type:complete len:300 (+) Transcript_21836:185-1084(+)|eukprot:CAMPEP_0119560738 /NCGR_PEP_ID=MMETSP1352-20130426/15724_1 /TAXON_ID=265584 /ORGANISM="Stauroneis constricta, Strain CCMP1120" /LENGTH=299 /DNA_ID=CAMNT_0007608787 /DNA_START=156 /DNA_END=1055 /DNA_ORIENTATION=+
MQYSGIDDTDNTSLHSCSLRSRPDDSSSIISKTKFRRGSNSDLSQPLTANLTVQQQSIDEELGDDPYFMFRLDLQKKLELVDESLIEYLQIVNDTNNIHELKDIKKQLKRNFKNAESNLRDVQMTVQLVENDREKFNHIDDGQLYERKTFCKKMQERILKSKDEMKEIVLQDERNKIIMRGGGGLLGATTDNQRMNTAFVIDNQAQASMMMQQQDETLDELGEVVTRVGEMAETINDEIGQQNKMLEQMEEDMTNAEEELGMVMGKLGKFLKTKDKWQLRTILGLSLTAFVLFFLVLYT